MIAIRIDDANFQERMHDIIAQARRPAGVLAAAGRAGANVLRRHFVKRDHDDPNKIAPDRRQHFWQQVAHSVQAPVVNAAGDQVTIQIIHPAIAQKVFGGTITAKRVHNLAIPQSDEAYGRAPSVFERETGMKLIFIKANGHAFLASRVDPNFKTLQVEYLLTPSVTQQADPDALPTDQELSDAVIATAQKTLDRQLEEGNR